jgi:hypothetical protein
MKKVVVCFIVIALYMSLFANSAAFAQERARITITLDIPTTLIPSLTRPENVFRSKTITVRLNNQRTRFQTRQSGHGRYTNTGTVTLNSGNRLTVTVMCSGLSNKSTTFRNVKSGDNIVITPTWRPSGPYVRITGWRISRR